MVHLQKKFQVTCPTVFILSADCLVMIVVYKLNYTSQASLVQFQKARVYINYLKVS